MPDLPGGAVPGLRYVVVDVNKGGNGRNCCVGVLPGRGDSLQCRMLIAGKGFGRPEI